MVTWCVHGGKKNIILIIIEQHEDNGALTLYKCNTGPIVSAYRAIAFISIKSVEVAAHKFTAIQLKIERAGVINPGLSYVLLRLKVGKNCILSY